MNLSELINEIFDKNIRLKNIPLDPKLKGDVETFFEYEGYDVKIMFNKEREGIVELIFTVDDSISLDSGEKRRVVHPPILLFAKIKDIALEYLRRFRPDILFYTGDTDEKNRIHFYDVISKVMQRNMPGYKLIANDRRVIKFFNYLKDKKIIYKGSLSIGSWLKPGGKNLLIYKGYFWVKNKMYDDFIKWLGEK